MSDLQQKIINGIIDLEKGYVNDPDDSGGETNFGITVDVARKYGYEGEMRDMTRELAFAIYTEIYWHVLCLDDIEVLSPAIARELADTGVNQGVERSATFLQRSLNVLNKRGTLYPDIKPDGNIGRITVNTLRAYLQLRGKEGEIILLRMLNSLQGAFYVDLAECREKDEKYVYGWFLNRVVI